MFPVVIELLFFLQSPILSYLNNCSIFWGFLNGSRREKQPRSLVHSLNISPPAELNVRPTSLPFHLRVLIKFNIFSCSETRHILQFLDLVCMCVHKGLQLMILLIIDCIFWLADSLFREWNDRETDKYAQQHFPETTVSSTNTLKYLICINIEKQKGSMRTLEELQSGHISHFVLDY